MIKPKIPSDVLDIHAICGWICLIFLIGFALNLIKTWLRVCHAAYLTLMIDSVFAICVILWQEFTIWRFEQKAQVNAWLCVQFEALVTSTFSMGAYFMLQISLQRWLNLKFKKKIVPNTIEGIGVIFAFCMACSFESITMAYLHQFGQPLGITDEV